MAPVRLRVPNRLVYSPHDYGPAISEQPWFQDPRSPANLPATWERHGGYLQDEGIAPVVVGEFGGWSLGDDADGRWQRTLLTYLPPADWRPAARVAASPRRRMARPYEKLQAMSTTVTASARTGDTPTTTGGGRRKAMITRAIASPT